jgi:bifunctional non-homologous end joining protein LigD
LTLHRYPDGISGEGFYQKEAPDFIPRYVDTVEIEKVEGGRQPQMACNSRETLVYLANLGTITFHVWLSRIDRLHIPDKLIFDLDPPGDDFEPVREAAFDLRKLMKELGLGSYVMTTGSAGLHVAVSLKRELDFDHVRRLAGAVSSRLASRHPEKYTTEVRKAKRKGRLFLDTASNSYGQTSVAPYSLRAREGCSVATPLDWDELHDSELHSQSYTIANIFRRLGQKEDPWKSFHEDSYSLGGLEERIEAL